ncbi:hypothetical protein I4F81_003362 [Pyropia yezoensis]|uniref:Uncharacterized protein n=1 Tax=Pyropia yezoensis TaxID=2788 RepID=A0ACC3BS02_PYRYE|nr:hypothetical protein I4F81_003362 [Neopyropia yezoensis]
MEVVGGGDACLAGAATASADGPLAAEIPGSAPPLRGPGAPTGSGDRVGDGTVAAATTPRPPDGGGGAGGRDGRPLAATAVAGPLPPPPAPPPLSPAAEAEAAAAARRAAFVAAVRTVSSPPLSAEQRRALLRVATARDYALLQGRPGAGKTTVVAALLAAAATAGLSVLLTAYTHAAVDNVLERLLQQGGAAAPRFVRLAPRVDLVDVPAVVPYTYTRAGAGWAAPQRRRRDGGDASGAVDDAAGIEASTVADVRAALDGVPIVATTCLGIGHAALARRTAFDLVLVDEATQVTEAVTGWRRILRGWWGNSATRGRCRVALLR